MKNNKSNHKSVIVASITASVLMLLFGLAYRLLAVRLGDTTSTIPIAKDSLEPLPLQISDWEGKDVPMDDAIVRGTDSDAHINRRYSRDNGLESVSLYIACGIKTAEIVYHQPSVCYPSSGWTLMEQHSEELQLSNGNKLSCTIYHFTQNELLKERSTVLHYWIADGQCFRDVSLLRSRLWRITSMINYIAQVQITCSVMTSAADSAEKVISEFAIDSAPLIAELFDSIQKNQDSESAVALKNRDNLQ
jgi:hypothetical protein